MRKAQHWRKTLAITLLGVVVGTMIGYFAVRWSANRKLHYVTRWPNSIPPPKDYPLTPSERISRKESTREHNAELLPSPSARVFQGRLLDSDTLRAVSHGSVSLHGHPDTFTESERDGSFDLMLSEASYPIVLLIAATDYPIIHLFAHNTPSQRADVHLYKQLNVKVLVADDITSEVIAGATIDVAIEGDVSTTTVTDANGITGLISLKPCLRYIETADNLSEALCSLSPTTIIASAAGYLPVTRRLEMNESSMDVLLRLRPASRVWGRVLDVAGTPIPMALVVSEWGISVGKDTREYGGTSVRSDSNGFFEFNVAFGREGQIQVAAGRMGYVPQFCTTDLARAVMGEGIVLTLEPGYTLKGQVVDEDRTSLDDIEIRLDSPKLHSLLYSLKEALGDEYGAPVLSTASTEDGLFAIGGLPQDIYSVSVKAPIHVLLAPKSINLTQDTDVEITMMLGKFVSGSVLDHNGEAILAARVHIVKPVETNAGPRGINVNSAGQFVLGPLMPEMQYYLSASAPDFRAQSLDRVEAGTEDVTFFLEINDGMVQETAGEMTFSATCNGFKVHEPNGYFLIGLYDYFGVRQGSFRRTSAIGGLLHLRSLPIGRFRVTISSDRYAPAVIENVSTQSGSPAIALNLRPGCLILGDMSEDTHTPADVILEIKDPETGLSLMPIFQPMARQTQEWKLGVLADGENYLIVAGTEPQLLTQTFSAFCDKKVMVRLDPISTK